MPNTNVDVTIPQALVINPDNVCAAELSAHLVSLGIVVRTCNEVTFQEFNLENFTYLAWFSNSADETSKYFSALNNTAGNTPKTLFIFGLDQVYKTQSDAAKHKGIITDVINQIHAKGRQLGLDIRVLCHQGAWDAKTNTVSSNIRGLDKINNTLIYPVNINDLVPEIINFWFDRGHRGITINVLGQPFEITSFRKNTVSPGWVIEEGIEGAESLVLPSNNEALIDFYKSIQNTTMIGPTRSSPLRFETVVVPSDQVIMPKPIENQLPIIPREIKKIITPKINPIPPRTIITQKGAVVGRPKLSINIKLPRFLLGALVGVVFLFLLVPFGIFFLSVSQAKNSSSNDDISQLDRKQKNIEMMAGYSNVVAGWTKSLPLTIGIHNELNRLRDSATEQLLITRAENYIATAVKRMVTATEGDPFVPLQQAKYALDDVYMFQSTHHLEDSNHRQWVIKTRQAIDLIPQLIPTDKKITILILLQNNLELRPTGGFIGSVALFTFDHGKLLNTDTRDIYDLDSNLKGLVNPPSELKTYLGESTWYFRDANWSPNFLDAAGTANWFLEKEWGSAADVIVGLNLNTYKSILSLSGSLTLPDGQILGSDNLMVSAFNHQDVPVIKPDAKKQEFLSLFIKPLLDKISQSQNDQVINILNGLGNAAEAGELTIASTNNVVLRELVDIGWAGDIQSPVCAADFSPPCASDFISVNEANVGINKSNYYLTRTIKHEIALALTQAKHTHTVKLTNSSPGDAWPGGSYKAYTRVLLPPNTTGVTITVDGNPVAANVLPSTSQKYQTIGFFLEVKPQASSSVEIKYIVPLQPGSVSYVFGLQKQQGATPDPFELTLTPPEDKSLSKTRINNVEGKTTNVSGTFDKNQVISIEYNP